MKKATTPSSPLVTDPILVATAIKIDFGRWPKNCSWIAEECIRNGCVPKGSKRCYGMFLGEIHSESVFSSRAITHHSWIELPDKRVYDPTRWVFEAVAPYVWLGYDNDDEYDLGGIRARGDRPFPELTLEPVYTVSTKLRRLLKKLVPDFDQAEIDRIQLNWIGHQHPDRWGDYAAELYQDLIARKLGWAIPIDLKQYVLGNIHP